MQPVIIIIKDKLAICILNEMKLFYINTTNEAIMIALNDRKYFYFLF